MVEEVFWRGEELNLDVYGSCDDVCCCIMWFHQWMGYLPSCCVYVHIWVRLGGGNIMAVGLVWQPLRIWLASGDWT